MSSTKHPNCKLELEVRVRDRDVLVEHALDRLLRPRAVLSHDSQPRHTQSTKVKEEPTGRWRDMTSLTARSMGSGCGYRAYMRAMAAQQVCTTCVCSCSTHAWTSQDWMGARQHPRSGVRTESKKKREGERERREARTKDRNNSHSHLVALAPAAVRTLPAD